MNKTDLGKVFVLFSVIAYVLLIVGSVFLSEWLNPFWLAGLFVLFQQLYVIPTFVRNYFRINELDIGIIRYVPIFNEYLIMPTIAGIIYVVATIVCLLSATMLLLKPTIFVALFGGASVESYYSTLMGVLAVSGLIACIVRGFCYLKMFMNINSELYATGVDYGNMRILKTLQYILLLVPIIRSLSISLELERMRKLLIRMRLNDVKL